MASFKGFVSGNWQWLAVFFASMGALQLQVANLVSNHQKLEQVVTKDHEALLHLRSDFDNFAKTTVDGFALLKEGGKENHDTLGSIRDYIMSGGRVPIDATPLLAPPLGRGSR